jgi:hypothetical protein
MLFRFALARRSATASSAQSVEHLGAAERGRERWEPEPGAELEHALAAHVERRHDFGKCDPTAPELGPVRQELVVIKRILVDQLVRVRRPQQRDLPAGELERVLDQSAAYRSTPTPSGS